jgi:hypothetical protein
MEKNYLINNLLFQKNFGFFSKYISVFVTFAICFSLFFSNNIVAQTTLISPTGDGGFETGATLALNNWLVDAPAQATRNQWICGTGATVGFSWLNAGYVTDNTAGLPPPHTYTTTTARFSHIYRDVTVPAGETIISLNFTWIGIGDGTLDKMKIWLAPTTFTPVNTAALTVLGGKVQIGLAGYSGQATWVSATSITIPASYAGTTFRLVFEWVNDSAVAGTSPPAGIDNISLISSNPTPCLAPVAQASAFVLGTPTATSVPASFSGTASGYLVVSSLTSTPPSQPVNGTIYTAANIATLGAGFSFVQSSASTSIAGTSLVGNTKYYYFIYAYNNTSCTGGPAYNLLGPLTGNGVTCPAIPNSVTTAAITSSSFTLNWAIPTGGSAVALTYTVQITTDSGYTANVGASPYTTSATTLNITGLLANTVYYYRILASNGCSSAYVSSSTSTILTPCVAPVSQANTFVLGAVTTSSISLTFSGTASGFLVVRSLTATPIPLQPVNGTIYTSANVSSLGAGVTFVQSGASTSISDLGLASGIQYFYFIYAYNNTSCSGGPTYNIAGALTGNGTTIAGINDDCSSAIPLTVTSACSYSTYTNAAATASTGVPAPGCANYLGNDVWFKAVVPATGILTVDTQTGVITDSGMAFYSGTCGALTLIACDDDSSANGLMSSITITGQTPGTTIYIRVWEYGNDNNGTFGICATSPTCVAPTLNAATGIGINTATINWTAPTSIPSNGYQYVVSTSNVTPTVAGIATTATTINLTGLSFNTTYYVFVRSDCGSGDYSSWTAYVVFKTLCISGTGDGTSALGCPSVISGGLGLSGADPAPINTCAGGTCVDLEATYLQLGQTTNYSVQSIPYLPPYQFSCLQNGVSINVDDVWSPTISLPFNFCFYGTNYNQCLIGSNGTITFDLVNNVPSGTSTWSFSSNLPNNTLFLNTIFGVYHDIDPSKGGEVGWELITLNSGCRALVASWNNIPMFSSTCNSQLYTGMMVLYEDTNIIEVYIKEKNVCPTWNGGNAIVGLQNGNGTLAVVAPSRNGLDTDWNTTNEAWRFTPSGTSITNFRWHSGTGTSGPVIATTNVINVCPTASTTYTAEVNYSFCNGTTLQQTHVTNVTVLSSKTWNGSVNTNWNVANNWTPNVLPNSGDCVIIPITANDPIISGVAYNGLAGTLLVMNGATLTVTPNNNITVTSTVTVQATGNFILENTASLIQISNIVNSGNIIYKRNATIRNLDYVYWSSPVSNFNITNIPFPLVPGPTYIWDPVFSNPNGGQGYWLNASGSTMTKGKGYIVRSPSGFSATPTTLNGIFTGNPNNGTITFPISRGSDTNTAFHTGINGTQIDNYSDNWNLLGNPYPSAIRASQFLFNNKTKIEGNVRLWTHGTLPAAIASPFYGTYAYNYTPSDYITYNFTGTTCCPAAGADMFIGAGQGFFVQMKDGAAASDIVTFTNNLRSATFPNTTFYKASNQLSSSIVNLERNRIWLDIIDANNQSDRTLVGYIENATMGNDSFFDSRTSIAEYMAIYSLIGNDVYNIQGRALPFDTNDVIPLGVTIPNNGTFSIAINALDGLFENIGQNIFLEDTSLGIIHDLRLAPYSFSAMTGNFEERFKLRFTNATLNTNNQDLNLDLSAYIHNQVFYVNASQNIESIQIFDITGKLVITYNCKSNSKFFKDSFLFSNGVYLAKIKLEEGSIISKKILQ